MKLPLRELFLYHPRTFFVLVVDSVVVHLIMADGTVYTNCKDYLSHVVSGSSNVLPFLFFTPIDGFI